MFVPVGRSRQPIVIENIVVLDGQVIDRRIKRLHLEIIHIKFKYFGLYNTIGIFNQPKYKYIP
jgi:hypothetical protein